MKGREGESKIFGRKRAKKGETMYGKIDAHTRTLIEEIVERKILQLLSDPDYGLRLRKAVRERLRRSLKSRRKGIPAAKVAKKLGLKW